MLAWGFVQLSADPLSPEVLQKRRGVTSYQVSACCARIAESLLLTCSSAGTGAGSPLCCIAGSAWPRLRLQQQLLAVPAPWPQIGPLSLQLVFFLLWPHGSFSWWISSLDPCSLLTWPEQTFFFSVKEWWRMVFSLQFADSSGPPLITGLKSQIWAILSPANVLGLLPLFFFPKFQLYVFSLF